MSKNKFYHNNNNKKKFDAQAEAQKVLEANKGKNQNFLKPIEELGLSEATYNALKAGRINIVADLACRTFQQMYKIQNIGKKNCIEISKAMSKLGAHFAQDEAQQAQQAKNSNPNSNQNGNQKFKNTQQNFSRDKSQINSNKADRRDGIANNKNKRQKSESDSLNEYLSRQYAGMTMSEIIMGKRQRPVVEKIERPPLTEKSLIKFCRKGKWGYKDWKGNVIVPPSYEEAFGFFEERACVEKDGKLGFIDRENNLIIDFKYDCATSFSEGLASVTMGEKSGYIDLEGNQIVDFIYDIATPFSDGKAIVRQNDRWGVLSRENLSVFWR
ncbi:MAG: WG repeat-containing protein [Clostridia bacterium]|nr:WG repeat-containing protein [Clostridia bacterium]